MLDSVKAVEDEQADVERWFAENNLTKGQWIDQAITV